MLREFATNTVKELAEQGTRLTPAQEGPEGLSLTCCVSLRQCFILFEPQIYSCMIFTYF